jgi:hypothetical protein
MTANSVNNKVHTNGEKHENINQKSNSVPKIVDKSNNTLESNAHNINFKAINAENKVIGNSHNSVRPSSPTNNVNHNQNSKLNAKTSSDNKQNARNSLHNNNNALNSKEGNVKNKAVEKLQNSANSIKTNAGKSSVDSADHSPSNGNSTAAQIVGRMQKRQQIKIITLEIHYEIVHRLSVLMRIKLKIK